MKYWNNYADKVLKGLKKYKYALLILLLGIAFLLIPDGSEEAPVQDEVKANDESYAQQMEERLTQALAQIDGVGKVQVVLTLHNGSYTHYHTDIQSSYEEANGTVSESEERKTVILSEGSAYDEAAVTTVDYPQFQGALIVCEGGGNAQVKLALIEAVAALTGLSSNKITVVKMK